MLCVRPVFRRPRRHRILHPKFKPSGDRKIMAKMRAIEAAVHVLEKEGITRAFGVPGAANNPLYAALRKHGAIAHVLARHVEGAAHMAEGYTRARAGNIGV